MGTLVFKHNGRKIRHEQCLYDPSYRNIISGLRMANNFTITEKVVLKTAKRVLYQIDRDEEGLWMKLANDLVDWKCAGIKRMNSAGTPKGKEAARMKGMGIFHAIPYILPLNTQKKLGKRSSGARLVETNETAITQNYKAT